MGIFYSTLLNGSARRRQLRITLSQETDKISALLSEFCHLTWLLSHKTSPFLSQQKHTAEGVVCCRSMSRILQIGGCCKVLHKGTVSRSCAWALGNLADPRKGDINNSWANPPHSSYVSHCKPESREERAALPLFLICVSFHGGVE